MIGILLLVFLVVPIAELAVLIKVGATIGVVDTIGLLLLVAVVGSWLVRREGLGVARRVRASLAAGRAPTNELLDGLLILVAGALLVLPGFLSDVVGLALLLPPVRLLVRRLVARRFQARLGPAAGGPSRRGPSQGYIDLP